MKNKLYLGVNVLSLAVGLICCLFAFIYIQDEFSYDKFHDKANQVYRVEYQTTTNDGVSNRFANLHGAVLPEGLNSIPEIELNTRFAPHADLNIQAAEEQFGEYEVLAADSNFFKVFDFPFLIGEPSTSLQTPNAVVIDKSTALKYFNSIDVLSETLIIQFQDNEVLLTITGVIEDVPSNSHFQFTLVTASPVYENLYGFSMDEVQMGYNYVQLFDHADPNLVQTKINELWLSDDPSFQVSYFLEKLTDIHLYSSDRGELEANSDIKYLYFLGGITFLILIIACFNFTTLAIARSIKRTTEIGVRKVYGALRNHLIGSFIIEGLVLAFLALVIAYACFWEFLPFINSLSGKSFAASQLTDPSFLIATTLLTLCIGGIAALYPAFFLTGNKPSALLLKHSSIGFRGDNLWRSVVIVQFTATLILISASYIIHQQIDFIQNKDLGFEKEQILTLPNYFLDTPDAFLQEIEQHPNIVSTTASSYIPGVSKTSGTALVETEDKSNGITFDWISVDPDYLTTYDINLISGRNFSKEITSDTTQAFIINETAANVLGWENPLDKSLTAFGSDGYVIGVIKDFNFLSLHNKISPLILLSNPDYYFSVSVKFQSDKQISETISFIETTWNQMLPGVLFSYDFVDDRFANVYKTEQRTQTLFLIFSVLAVFIAILGLFSFATYSIQQKQKEIGIRKVLGATVRDMLGHFYRGYLTFLIISSVIAFPIVYFWAKSWLQNFSYHAQFGLDAILIPVLLTFLALLISVSYQVIKGALANPVDSIRMD
ncbi:MAG TPA: FtsX-like permease family protein [Gracilimonas sp.]|uniref:ABC transporter permease n=1 Tax=Gracilimonas sp. TaxID=1974203 RepID=UPI002DB2A7B8|nr:FtsX-like permease family protein [Gracilimonas sp.]